MKLESAVTHPPMPLLLPIDGQAPRYDAIPHVRADKQPHSGVRPLYWWVRHFTEAGHQLRSLHFDTLTLTALVTVQLRSGRVLESVRRLNTAPADTALDHTRAADDTVPALLAEATWRLGVTGWSDDLADVVALLRTKNLLAPAKPVVICRNEIPGLPGQCSAFRVAYWWAMTLLDWGWRLHEVGSDVAGGGFLAEIPGADGNTVLAIYTSDVNTDFTAATALAQSLPYYTAQQVQVLRHLIEVAATKKGPVQ